MTPPSFLRFYRGSYSPRPGSTLLSTQGRGDPMQKLEFCPDPPAVGWCTRKLSTCKRSTSVLSSRTPVGYVERPTVTSSVHGSVRPREVPHRHRGAYRSFLYLWSQDVGVPRSGRCRGHSDLRPGGIPAPSWVRPLGSPSRRDPGPLVGPTGRETKTGPLWASSLCSVRVDLKTGCRAT